MKTQTIRVADVLVIGPLMVWAGLKLRAEHPVAGSALALMGAGTVVYNGRNWLKHRKGGVLPGGYADRQGKTAADVDPGQLRKGVKVEMEHTTDPAVAMEIATDHLIEDARYYDKLLAAGL
jgi:hypothetical protein